MILAPNSWGVSKKVWIYGDGEFANILREYLHKQKIEVIGTITRNYFEMGNVKGGLELYRRNSYPVFIGVFNHKDNPIEIIEYLEGINAVKIVTPAQICIDFSEIEFSKYYLSTELSKFHSKKSLLKIINYLSDDTSKEVFKGFVSYQKTGDVRNLVRSATADVQYLGRTLPSPYKELWLAGKICWVDIGSFDGDTLRCIENFGRNMEKDEYICIEPDIKNFDKLLMFTSKLKSKVKLLNIAIGERSSVIDFVHEGTLSAHIQDKNSNLNLVSEVKISTIDNVCANLYPTHVKMDIEGSEMGALKGGAHTLIRCRPKLAISLYHKPRDIVEIPLYLMKLLPRYNWFIRCYGAHGYDTILYGIPK